ncbi:MAG TPA: hypothetical protein VD859_05440, partial [Nocardioides sp.]|nr:hypothetical protein [Nocardioides sp.]
VPIVLLVLVGAITVAYWAGQANAGPREEEASCDAGAKRVTCTVEGDDSEKYSVGWQGGVDWINPSGDRREGRPACLRRGEDIDVVIGIVDVEHEAASWTEVMWVDCRR